MKILILTSEYPNPKSNYDTPVVHYYAKEWLEQGHEIKVVHYRSVFPKPFYFIANIFNKTLKKIFKTDFIPNVRLSRSLEYTHEGIKVKSQPIFKIFPHFKFFNSTIAYHAKILYNDNLNNNFKPDRIIAHFVNPQLPLISELKKYYPFVKSSLVVHENPKVIFDLYKEKSYALLNNLNTIGFRFNEMRNKFINLFGENYNMFICPSGIPENYILKNVPKSKFKSDKISICFVGMLIPLKNVDILLNALSLAFPNRNFSLDIVGEGMLKNEISRKIIELDLSGCVNMLGKLSREEVQNKMNNTDVFVMVSSPEAFGLVYLEAMSKGCITIGTVGQGIDGIIENGKNGFLCKARNVESLKSVITEVNNLSYTKKIQLATNSINTAASYTNKKVALEYLKKIDLK